MLKDTLLRRVCHHERYHIGVAAMRYKAKRLPVTPQMQDETQRQAATAISIRKAK